MADVLGRSVSEAEALARQWGWPGTRVDDGLISVDPERARSTTRRRVQVGDRRFGVTECGPDIFMYAPLVRPSIQVEETCPATGTPILLVLTPSGVERVEPSVDANLCVTTPLFSSAEAAQGWLADHPGGRVFPIEEAWELFRPWRDHMSAVMKLNS